MGTVAQTRRLYRTWARVLGITVALVSAIANVLWLPYYPFWALTIITLDIFVMGDRRPRRRAAGPSLAAASRWPASATTRGGSACDRPDGSCAGLAVRRLSSDRVQELAEEIWTASSGELLPARPGSDPRSSRAGASAQAAYVRRRARNAKAGGRPWGGWS